MRQLGKKIKHIVQVSSTARDPIVSILVITVLYTIFMLMLTGFINLVFPETAKGNTIDCRVHKIYCRVVKLNPYVDKDWAMEFSNILYKESKKAKTNPMISVAIAQQENSFINRSVEIVTIRTETVCNDTGCDTHIITKRTNDIGLYQINEHTAKAYGYDTDKLMKDWQYSTKCHIKILKQKMKLCQNLNKDSWSCYHSATPDKRLKYIKDVGRYLK